MQNFWKWLVLVVAVAGGGFAVFQVNESLTQLTGRSATNPAAAAFAANGPSDVAPPTAAIEPTLAAPPQPLEPTPAPNSDFVPVDRFAATGEPAASDDAFEAAPYDDLLPEPVDDFAAAASMPPTPEPQAELPEFETSFDAVAAAVTETVTETVGETANAVAAGVDVRSLRGQSPEAAPAMQLAQASQPSLRDKLGQIGARLRGEPAASPNPQAQLVNEFDGLMTQADVAAARTRQAAQQAFAEEAAAVDAFAGAAAAAGNDLADAGVESIDMLGSQLPPAPNADANPFAAFEANLPPQQSAAAMPPAAQPPMSPAASPNAQTAQAMQAMGQLPQAAAPAPIGYDAAELAAQPTAQTMPPQPAASFAPQTAEPSRVNPLDAVALDAMSPAPGSEPIAAEPPAAIQPAGFGMEPTYAGQGFETNERPQPANFDLSRRDERRNAIPDRIRVESEPLLSALEEVEPQPKRVASRDLTDQLMGRSTIDRDVVRGPVQPELQILKQAPKKASIGDPMVYSIVVKNIGRSTAHKVVVEDRVPKGSRLSGTRPKAEMSTVRDENVLFWEYDAIGPGEEKLIQVKVVPTSSGQIGSITTVRMVAETAAETIITAPELRIDLVGQDEAQLGEVVEFEYQIANTGSEDAYDVVIRSILPEGFQHSRGADIAYEVGTLRAGESKKIPLPLRAIEVGRYDNEARLTARGGVTAETSRPISIIKSRLSIERSGPGKRFVGTSSEFMNLVRNNSSRTLRNVRVVEELPAGVEFATATNNGTRQAGGRSIVWMIPSLPPGGERELSATVVARQPGLAMTTVKAESEDGSRAMVKTDLNVIGFSSLKVETDHANTPFPVGATMPLKVKIRNGGSAPAHSVSVDMIVPDNLRVVEARGPKAHQVNGSTISFDPLEVVQIDQTLEYYLMVEAIGEGNTPLRLQLQSEELNGRPMLHDEELRTYLEDYSR